MQALSSPRVFWSLWWALLGAKLVLAARLPLFGDEAWYWLEGQRLAWAYSDLPGLTAWLIRVGVEVGGDSTLGVRWPFIALAMGIPLLMRAAARQIEGVDAREAGAVGVLSMLLPLLGALGPLALPDVPLSFATAACLFAVLRLRVAVDTTGIAWLATGLALGALSHYRFAPILLAGAVGLLLDDAGRRLLRQPSVWLALGVGAVAWMPLVVWNFRHAGAGLEFQFADRHPWRLHPEGWILPSSQLLVVSPLLLLALLFGLRVAWRRWRAGIAGPWGFVFGAAAVPLLLYLVLAFFADTDRVSFHWLLQGWMPLLLLAPAVLARWTRPLRALTLALAGVGLVGIFAYAATATMPAARSMLADTRAYPDNFAGWPEIAEKLRAEPAPGRELVADNFMLGAQLAFALQRPGIPTLDHPLNHKHGRALQLRLWDLETRLQERSAPWRLVVEDSARPLRDRLEAYQALCRAAGSFDLFADLTLDHGRKRFLIFDGDPGIRRDDCILPAFAWIDAPAPRASVVLPFDVVGWAFKDGAGVARVELTLDGEVVAEARYGEARPHVAAYWATSRDPAHPDVGFSARLPAGLRPPGRYWLGLRLHGRDGRVEHWPEQRLEIAPPEPG
jgi:4-amino-4-deoxy-L-arabinose transferase-like glycosyltransferase